MYTLPNIYHLYVLSWQQQKTHLFQAGRVVVIGAAGGPTTVDAMLFVGENITVKGHVTGTKRQTAELWGSYMMER